MNLDKIVDLIKRLERMRGPYLGDGINPGVTTTELIEALQPFVYLNELIGPKAVHTMGDITVEQWRDYCYERSEE